MATCELGSVLISGIETEEAMLSAAFKGEDLTYSVYMLNSEYFNKEGKNRIQLASQLCNELSKFSWDLFYQSSLL